MVIRWSLTGFGAISYRKNQEQIWIFYQNFRLIISPLERSILKKIKIEKCPKTA